MAGTKRRPLEFATTSSRLAFRAKLPALVYASPFTPQTVFNLDREEAAALMVKSRVRPVGSMPPCLKSLLPRPWCPAPQRRQWAECRRSHSRVPGCSRSWYTSRNITRLPLNPWVPALAMLLAITLFGVQGGQSQVAAAERMAISQDSRKSNGSASVFHARSRVVSCMRSSSKVGLGHGDWFR